MDKQRCTKLTTDVTLTVHFNCQVVVDVYSSSIYQERAEYHTERNTVNRLTGITEEWEIPHRSISVIVHDNAANAVLGVQLTDWPHFTGMAHTPQSCIDSGLNLPVIDRLTAVSMTLVSHLKNTVVATTALEEKLGQLGISLHCFIHDM